MRTKKISKYVISVMLILSMVLGVCGCSGKKKTLEDFRKEAAIASETIIRKVLSGDYEMVKRYVKEADLQYAKPVVSNMAPGIIYHTSITIEDIFTEEGSYDTEVHYRLSFVYEKTISSISLVMRLERNGNSWAIANAQGFFYDINQMNSKYVYEKEAEENAKS